MGDGPDYKRGNLLWSVAMSISHGLAVFFLAALVFAFFVREQRGCAAAAAYTAS